MGYYGQSGGGGAATEVASYADLPASAADGEVYKLTDLNIFYYWNDTASQWVRINERVARVAEVDIVQATVDV